jgi:uncharacterized protein
MRARTGAGGQRLGFALALALVGLPVAARGETPIPPPPADWVTDKAGFLSATTASELDGRLDRYARSTGHQLLVYIDRTTGGVPIEDWAVKAFERWKVGRQGIDDGVVLFIFKDDHKARIEVGYGLEDRVPDALAVRIIDDQMVPRIRAGDQDGAVVTAVGALMTAIGVGATGPPAAKPIPMWKVVAGGILVLLFIGFLITHPGLAWLLLMNVGSGRGGGGFGGGGFGGGGGFSGGGGRSGGGGASGSW